MHSTMLQSGRANVTNEAGRGCQNRAPRAKSVRCCGHLNLHVLQRARRLLLRLRITRRGQRCAIAGAHRLTMHAHHRTVAPVSDG